MYVAVVSLAYLKHTHSHTTPVTTRLSQTTRLTAQPRFDGIGGGRDTLLSLEAPFRIVRGGRAVAVDGLENDLAACGRVVGTGVGTSYGTGIGERKGDAGGVVRGGSVWLARSLWKHVDKSASVGHTRAHASARARPQASRTCYEGARRGRRPNGEGGRLHLNARPHKHPPTPRGLRRLKDLPHSSFALWVFASDRQKLVRAHASFALRP